VFVNTLMLALVAELHTEGIPDPLSTRLTLAALWDDLARLAGEELPADVAAALDAPVPLVPVVPVRRGSYATHRREFPERYPAGVA